MSSSRIEAADCFILFADLQDGITELSVTMSPERLKKGVGALAKLATLFDIPAIVTAIPGEDGTAKIMSEIGEELGPIPTHYRSTADSFLNPAIANAIKASGRKTILIAGVATELAVLLPTLTGIDLGYRTFMVLDACGGTSERSEQAAILRATGHGASTVALISLAGELAGDFGSAKAQQAIGILFSMAHAS